ncbi:NADH(P)-binding-domain-containing protein [Russula brevipes]|nr:NADH(P)-binding-domain-containing protein [Russula brevipes]
MSKKVVIVGGHGKIALRLTQLLGDKQYTVTSIIRKEEHIPEIAAISPSAVPLVLSLESSPASEFTAVFSGADTPERTRTVDYEGAVKVFDALEAVPGKRPHLLLVSSADNDADKASSARARLSLSNYFHWKYQADKDLVRRTAFPWTILRPTGLLDGPGTGCADIGRTHVTALISRDDVALILAELVERVDAAGLVIDIEGGDVPIADGLDKFIKKGETDWLG